MNTSAKSTSHILALWCVCVLVCGALLAPPLFWCGRALVHGGWLPGLAPFAFPTYLRRAWLLCALVGARWLMHQRALDWRPGPQPAALALRQLTAGAALGVAGVAALLFGLVWADWMHMGLPDSMGATLALAANCLASASLVAVLEETVFRGVVQRSWVRRCGLVGGSIVQLLLFAAIHFVAVPARGPVEEHVAWYAGLEALLALAQPPMALPQLLVGFVSLLALGAALTLATWRSNGLWLAIGLHGGWVFGLRWAAQSARRVHPADIWLDRELRAGILPMVLAIATTAVLAAWPKHGLLGLLPNRRQP